MAKPKHHKKNEKAQKALPKNRRKNKKEAPEAVAKYDASHSVMLELLVEYVQTWMRHDVFNQSPDPALKAVAQGLAERAEAMKGLLFSEIFRQIAKDLESLPFASVNGEAQAKAQLLIAQQNFEANKGQPVDPNANPLADFLNGFQTSINELRVPRTQYNIVDSLIHDPLADDKASKIPEKKRKIITEQLEDYRSEPTLQAYKDLIRDKGVDTEINPDHKATVDSANHVPVFALYFIEFLGQERKLAETCKAAPTAQTLAILEQYEDQDEEYDRALNQVRQMFEVIHQIDQNVKVDATMIGKIISDPTCIPELIANVFESAEADTQFQLFEAYAANYAGYQTCVRLLGEQGDKSAREARKKLKEFEQSYFMEPIQRAVKYNLQVKDIAKAHKTVFPEDQDGAELLEDINNTLGDRGKAINRKVPLAGIMQEPKPAKQPTLRTNPVRDDFLKLTGFTLLGAALVAGGVAAGTFGAPVLALTAITIGIAAGGTFLAGAIMRTIAKLAQRKAPDSLFLKGVDGVGRAAMWGSLALGGAALGAFLAPTIGLPLVTLAGWAALSAALVVSTLKAVEYFFPRPVLEKAAPEQPDLEKSNPLVGEIKKKQKEKNLSKRTSSKDSDAVLSASNDSMLSGHEEKKKKKKHKDVKKGKKQPEKHHAKNDRKLGK